MPRRPVPRRGGPVALALVLAVLAGAACSQAASPTQAEYAAAADGVCQATADRLEDLEERRDIDAYEAAATGESNLLVDRPDRWFRAKVIPAYRSMLGNLQGIQPPDGDSSYLADLYQDLDFKIRDLNTRPSEGRDLIRADTRLQQRFASYGMEICGTV